METRYKFLRLIDGVICSDHDQDCVWQVGERKSVAGEIEPCENGLHCSRRIFDAFTYVKGEILAEVEVDGAFSIGSDKEAWQHMTIAHACLWQKQDSVALSIFASELVLENFEKLYPEDDRPCKAIEAARTWLENPTEENRSAAYSAYSAARSAYSAARSAAYTAYTAYSAAYSAYSAARSAAYTARSVAYLAYSAAYSAYSAYSAAYSDEINNKIEVWMEERIQVLHPYHAAIVSDVSFFM